MTTQNQRGKWTKADREKQKKRLKAQQERARRHEEKIQELMEIHRIREVERKHFGSEATNLFDIEGGVRREIREEGRRRLEEKLRAHGTCHEGNSRPCPKCGAHQKYKGDFERTIETEFGKITLSRAYYVCPECGHGCFPLDEKLGLHDGDIQGKLRESAVMLSVLVPYESASLALERIYGRSFDPRSLQRFTEERGRDVLTEDRGEEARLSLSKIEGGQATTEAAQSVSPPKRLYVGADGVMAPTREARKDAEDQGHREAKVLRLFEEDERVTTSRKHREILRGDMAGRICVAEEFQEMLHARFTMAGGHRAEEVVALGDGSKWIWNVFEAVAPKAIQILDFFHLMTHIHDAVKAAFGEGNTRRRSTAKRLETALKESRIDHVEKTLRSWQGRTIEDKETIRKTLAYIDENRNRMDYHRYIARGYDIGSGTIESTGKRLVGQRLKGPGMRWNRETANALLALRSRWYTNRWAPLWSKPEALAA